MSLDPNLDYHQSGSFLDRLNKHHKLHKKLSKNDLASAMAHYSDRSWPKNLTVAKKIEILAAGEFLRKYGRVKEYILTLSLRQLNQLIDLFRIDTDSSDFDDLVRAVVDYANELEVPSESENEEPAPRSTGPMKLFGAATKKTTPSSSGSSSNESDGSQAGVAHLQHHDLFESASIGVSKGSKQQHSLDEESVADTRPVKKKLKHAAQLVSVPDPDGDDSDSSVAERARRAAYDKARSEKNLKKKAEQGSNSTDFSAYNSQNEDEVHSLCSCHLCRAHWHAKTISVENIIKACSELIPPFRQLIPSTPVKLAREYLAAVWWSVHHHDLINWETLRVCERMFLTDCVDLPATWSLAKRSKMAEIAVKACYIDIIPLLEKLVAQSETPAVQSASAKGPVDIPSKSSGLGSLGHAAAGSPSNPPTQQAIVKRLLSQAVKPLQWLSRQEKKDLLSANRVAKLGPNGAAAPILPYSEYPWSQSLLLESEAPVDMLRAGRMLNIAGRNSTAAFSSPMETLARDSRKAQEEVIFSEFDSAFRHKNLAQILLSAEHIKTFHRKTLDSSTSQAELWVEQHNIPLTQEVLAGRKQQQNEFNDFFASITLWIQLGSAAQSSEDRNTYIIGAWSGFFQGLRSSHFCQDFTAATLARGKSSAEAAQTTSTSSSDSDEGDSTISAADRRSDRRSAKDAKRKSRKVTAPAPGGGKAGSGFKGPGPKVVFQKHYHCSATILGPKLGVACSASQACRHCSKMGHWSGECAEGWYNTLKVQLPGYSKEGKRLTSQWDANKNPRRACARDWVRFLKSKKHFPEGGLPALEQGAPSLSTYESWAGKAQK